MPKSWKDIIADADAKDDAVIEISGEKLTLGELRAFQRQLEADVAKREEGVQQVLQALENQSKEPARVEEPKPVPSEGTIDYGQDPLFAPLWGKLTAVEKQNKEIVDALRMSSQQTASQIAAALDIQYRDIFERNREKYEGVDYDAAVKYARENRIMNQRGILDPVRAADQMTAGARTAKEKQAEYERGKADAMNEIRQRQGASAIAMPGISRSFSESAFQPDLKRDMASNLKEAVAKAFRPVQ